MNLEERRQIKKVIDLLLRRKSILFICLLIAIASGLALYLKMPKVYRCASLLKYQRQSVNPSAMSPDDIRTQTRDAVETVSQQILSRSSLESIIEEFSLYSEMQKTVPMEVIVDIMREKHIQTNFLQKGDVFEVSYQGKNQEKILKVTNALASKFIEENLRYRQERASQTSSYVKDELEMAKKSLDIEEQKMRDYKLKYYNEMPDQLVNNTNRLNALQEQYQNNQVSLQEQERTRLLVQEQISLRKEFLSQLSADMAVSTTGSSPTTDLSDINQVRLKLQNLQTRYTDKHPEIRRLKKILRDLEAQQGISSDEVSAQGFDPQIEELKQQLKDVEFNMTRLKNERENLIQQIEKYERWIAAAPVREAEWSALTRDYEQLNLHYQGLVTQSLQADSAQTLENQQRGSQFKIVDSAHFPEKPFKPDFKKIMLVAIGMGLICGVCFAFMLEILGTSFKNPHDLENYLDLPIICAVPAIYTKKETLRKKTIRISWYTILILAYIGIVVSAVFFWKQGKLII